MIILVAGVAGVMLQWIGITARGMALFAIHRLVFTCQFESRAVVVEIFHGTGRPEGILVVAVGAIGPEFIFMHILVAAGAIVGVHTETVLENGGRGSVHVVASGAVCLPVFPFQGEMGFAVVEFF